MDFDPGRFQLSRTYRSINGQLNRLPRTKWTLAIGLIILVLLDHWFIWPILIVGSIVLVAWLVRIVILRRR